MVEKASPGVKPTQAILLLFFVEFYPSGIFVSIAARQFAYKVFSGLLHKKFPYFYEVLTFVSCLSVYTAFFGKTGNSPAGVFPEFDNQFIFR